jgi:hypothetical protein
MAWRDCRDRGCSLAGSSAGVTFAAGTPLSVIAWMGFDERRMAVAAQDMDFVGDYVAVTTRKTAPVPTMNRR